jgi:hypothetical protein
MTNSQAADALRLLADLFSESAHETWTREEIVNIIEDAIRLRGEPQSPWMPIETAPKDGTSILVTMAGGGNGPYYVLYWNDSFFESVESGEGPSIDHLTHWMPLAEPPDTRPDRKCK